MMTPDQVQVHLFSCMECTEESDISGCLEGTKEDFASGVAECKNFLNDDGECAEPTCKLSPFYVGQDDDYDECANCNRFGCKGQCE